MARHHYETLQQVFDDAYRGLAAQGFERSMMRKLGDKLCAYRGTGGRRCAIGHCIPDDIKPAETDFYTLIADEPRIKALFKGLPLDKLSALQFAHDNSEKPDIMRQRLAVFADFNGLTIPSIEGAA